MLSEKQAAFIEYLVDPGAKPSQGEWCAQNEVPVRTATGWKKHKGFREEWEKRAYEVYGGPDRVGRVVESVFAAAVLGDMKAAQLYLQYVDKFTPTRKVVSESTKGLSDMTDEELEQALANVHSMRQRREAS